MRKKKLIERAFYKKVDTLGKLPSGEYVSDLLNSLQSTTPETSAERVRGIKSNLRLLEGGKDRLGSCVMIDEGGIYLTARHVVTVELVRNIYSYPPRQWIKDPYEGVATSVEAIIIHPEADIALAFAPTGKEYRAVPSLHFQKDISDDQNLYMVGLIPMLSDKGPTRYVTSGKVDESITFSGRINNVDDANVAVMGMTPYGGTSGCPIVDQSGSIVGIESGFVLTGKDTTNDVSNYDGSRIVPIDYALDLASFEPRLLRPVGD